MKNLLYITLIIIALNVKAISAVAQEIPYSDAVVALLNADERNNLTEAIEKNKTAISLEKESSELWKEVDEWRRKATLRSSTAEQKNTAKNKLKEKRKAAELSEVQALELNKTAYSTAYNIYLKNIKVAGSAFSGTAEQKKEAKLNIDVAENNYNEAQASRKDIEKAATETIALEIKKEAAKLEYSALQQLMAAFSIYLNFEYTDVNSNDSDEVAKALFGDNDFSEVLYETVINENPIVATPTETEVTANIDESNPPAAPVTKPATPKKTTNQSTDKILFRIQIAADNIEVPDEKLKAIYSGTMKVDHIVNKNGWHKYSIGEFSTYEKALELKLSCGVEGAFIVGYKNNVKIDILEAIRLSK